MEIVFVHLGSRIPKHLRLNLRRTSELFPEKKIVLITDQTLHLPKGNYRVERVISHDDFDLASRSLNHPLEFRNGFWISTLLRLTAVARFAQLASQPILHVESDVILSRDFPFKKLENLGEVASFPLVSPGQAVASILYIGSKSVGTEFSNFIDREVQKNPNTSDMRVLDAFREFSPESVEILPTGPNVPIVYLDSYLTNFLDATRKNLDALGGVFDAIDIGFFLFGEDPRNNRGFRNIRKLDDSSYLRLTTLGFSFDKRREFINLEYAGKSYPLYTLHIHSKDSRAFKLMKFQELAKIRILTSTQREEREFVLLAFMKLLIPFLKRRLKFI